MSQKKLLHPFSLRYRGLLQLAGNKAFCMSRSAVLLRSVNTPQWGGFAVFARNTATGAFLAMSRVGIDEEVSAAHKITGRERVRSRICGLNVCLSTTVAVPLPLPSSASCNRLRPVQKLCIRQVVDV